MAKIAPVHPGEILKEEFMVPLGLSANRIALDIRVPANRLTKIINGERAISADTALRLGKYFGTGPQFWLNLQNHYDLCVLEDTDGPEILEQVRPYV